MSTELHHPYRETTRWTESVGFWSRLGLSFEQQWGSVPHRAGTLVSGTGRVVLAEVAPESEPAEATFLETSDIDAVSHATETAIVDTHWGTRMVSVTDPDGRTYNFEPRSDQS
jgi:hypothetical protein